MKYSKEVIAKMRLASNLIEPPAAQVIGELLDEIERLQAERRWIPVSERLPKYGRAVLIMTKTSVVPKIGVHSPTIPQWATTDLFYYHDISYSQVTHWHWMPLPPPPEEEE